MIRVAVAGLGKMALSHLAVLRAHPNVEVTAACDGLSYLSNNLQRFTGIRCYTDYNSMLDQERVGADD